MIADIAKAAFRFCGTSRLEEREAFFKGESVEFLEKVEIRFGTMNENGAFKWSSLDEPAGIKAVFINVPNFECLIKKAANFTLCQFD